MKSQSPIWTSLCTWLYVNGAENSRHQSPTQSLITPAGSSLSSVKETNVVGLRVSVQLKESSCEQDRYRRRVEVWEGEGEEERGGKREERGEGEEKEEAEKEIEKKGKTGRGKGRRYK